MLQVNEPYRKAILSSHIFMKRCWEGGKESFFQGSRVQDFVFPSLPLSAAPSFHFGTMNEAETEEGSSIKWQKYEFAQT